MNSLPRVFSYLKPYKPLVALSLSFAIMTTLMDLIPPWLIKIVIDMLVEGVPDSTVYWVAGSLGVSYLARNLFNYKRIMLNNKVEQKVVYDIRSHVFQSLQKMSLNYFENRSTGEIMSRVNDDVTHVERIFIDGIEQASTAILTLIGITGILFYMHWKLALAALIPIPLLAYGAWKYTHQARDLYYQQRERAAGLNAILQDIVSGIKETLAYNRQNRETGRFNEKSHAYCEGTLTVMRLWAIYSPAMMFLGSLGTVFILFYGISAVQAEELTLGSLVAFLSYLTLFYTPINQLHSLNNMLQQALASSKRLFEIIDFKPDVIESAHAILPSTPSQGSIAFENVCFSYLKEKAVLKDVSFEIGSGKTVALVGHTGSGKSTAVKLLMRFYDADSGRILIDDRPIQDLKISYLRDQIGLVSQEPFLFNGTVLDNILYGKLEATREEAVEAAKAAFADEFIQNLPSGYETVVGERGVKLSGGERHRIAIARAILKDPAILILDEATASVDTETEAKIQTALERLADKRTTLIIAHRLSTLENADSLLVLQEGQLVEMGNHDELMERNSIYSRLFQSQVRL
jgi:ABC-type multidrug transport system fused ATPase/permease subunit